MSRTETVSLPRRGASAEQLRAVYEVMRILADDDRDRGTPPTSTIVCAACRRDRPAPGAVDYDGVRLCNGCATDYEVLRMAAVVDDVAGFLGRAPAPTAG
jgi:hypothetical protein